MQSPRHEALEALARGGHVRDLEDADEEARAPIDEAECLAARQVPEGAPPAQDRRVPASTRRLAVNESDDASDGNQVQSSAIKCGAALAGALRTSKSNCNQVQSSAIKRSQGRCALPVELQLELLEALGQVAPKAVVGAVERVVDTLRELAGRGSTS